MTNAEKEALWTLSWLIKNAQQHPEKAPQRLQQARERLDQLLLPPLPLGSQPPTYPTTVELSPNRGGTIRPEFIVLHSSYGSFAGTRSWILQARSKVSYHYLIASDGARTQFVPTTKRAWHAGKSSYQDRTGLNSCSIGVSFWGPSSRDPSTDEIDSCAGLTRSLMTKFSIPKSRILTHQMIAPTRKDDCSEKSWRRVMQQI